MKTPSPRLIRSAALGLVLLGAAVPAVRAQVMPAAKRQASLALINEALGRKDLPLVDKLPDPFYSAAFAEVSGQVAAPSSGTTGGGSSGDGGTVVRPTSGPRNDRDILAGIAAALKPSGFFVLGGQPTLVFGQKRVKAGGALTITFEGTEYTVEITALNRTNFTLRLNREEFTRPIK